MRRSYLLYVDDCKKHLKDTSIGALGGFIIPESSVHSFISSINTIKLKHGLKPEDPIKWTRDNKKVAYGPLKSVEEPNKLKADILSLIGSFPDLHVQISIHDAEQRKDEAYFETEATSGRIFTLLLSRFQFFLTEVGGNGTVIMGMPGDKKSKKFSNVFNKMKHGSINITTQNWFSPALLKVRLQSIEDSLYYCYEEHSTLMQVADFVVSSLCWTIERKNLNYYSLISNKVRTARNLKKGAGIVIDPHYSKTAEILL